MAGTESEAGSYYPVDSAPRYGVFFPPHRRLFCLFLFALLVFGYTRGVGLALFDEAELDGRGPVFYASVLVVSGYIITALKFRKTGLVSNFYFKAILCCYAAIAFADVMGAFRVYHQPLLGAVRDCFWYSGFLIFPVFFMWRGDINFIRQLVTVYLAFALFSVLLCDAASIVPQLRGLISEGTQSERFGLSRIRSIEIVPFAFYYFLVRLTRERHSLLKNAFFVLCFALVLFNLFYVSLTRQIIISVLASCLFYFGRHLRFRIRPVHFGIIAILLSVSLVTEFNILTVVEKTIDSFASNADATDKNNVDVRVDSTLFYLNQFRSTDYVGIGKISTVYSTDNIITKVMEEDHYFLADLGLLAVLFQYGVPAIILLIKVVWRMFNDLSCIHKAAPVDLASIAIAIELTLVGDVCRLWFMFFRNDLCFFYAFYFFVIVRILIYARSELTALPSSLQVAAD